jgi:hypothetical protein
MRGNKDLCKYIYIFKQLFLEGLSMEERNGIAKVLNVFGYIIIGLGVISGFYYGTSDAFDTLGDLQGGLAWGVVLQGLIIGLLFLGISEIIFQLRKIANKETPTQNISNIRTPDPVRNTTTTKRYQENTNADIKTSGPVSERVLDEIEKLFSEKDIIVQYVKATAKETIYYVKTTDADYLVENKPGYLPVIKSEIKI